MRAFLPIALVVAFACLSDGCGSKCETTSAPAATEKTGAMMDGSAGGIAADGVASVGGAADESCSHCPMEAAAKAACAEEKASKGCCEEEKSCCPSEAKPVENGPAR